MVVGEAAEQRPTPILVVVPRDQGGSCASLAAEFEVAPGCRVTIDLTARDVVLDLRHDPERVRAPDVAFVTTARLPV